ncbi:MAG: hypothetical protein U0W40_19720 [Acidimicrobiia bacterium]
MSRTTWLRRAAAPLAAAVLATGVAVVGAASASAAPIGTLTFNGLIDQDSAFSVTTSAACPSEPTLATNFLVRITGGDLPVVTPAANITGNTDGATVGGINGGPFTASASNTLRNFAGDQGLTKLGDGTYTIEVVCRRALQSASLGEFVGTFVVAGDNVITSAPTNSVAPKLSGTVRVGGTATCSAGTWVGATSYSYTFAKNGVALPASASSSLVLGAADLNKTLTCSVVATNAVGSSAPVASAGVKVAVGAAPVARTKPKITGTAKVRKTLKANRGVWSPTASYSYTYIWKRSGKVVKQGATATSYKLTKKDKKKKITLTVVVKRAGYTNGIATSAAVTVK